MSFSLTVFFEDPFWVGVFSRTEAAKTCYCRVVFGGEPSDTEIYHYFLKNWHELRFSAAVPEQPAGILIKNPKRRQRAVNRLIQEHTGEKRSYAIIKQTLHSEGMESRQTARKAAREAEETRRFELKKAQRRAKQRGR